MEVINLAEDQVKDWMEELTALLTSFAAGLFGQRRGRKKTQAAIKVLKER